MILVRADGNASVGSGHVMRCLAIADALRRQGAEVAFVMADDAVAKQVNDAGFSAHILGSKYDDMEAELPRLLQLVERYLPAFLLVDSYFVTGDYIKMLRSAVPVAYMDDCAQCRYPADCVVNYALSAEKMGYAALYEGTDTKLLLGGGYAPLRRDFQNVTPRVCEKSIRDVLISTGGADSKNITHQLLSFFTNQLSLQGIHWHVVVGAMNTHKRELEILEKQYCQRITLHENVKEMSALMRSCDAAISAGGSTLFELCTCGVPSASFSYVDNQLPNVHAFSDIGAIPYCGDFRNGAEQVCMALAEYLSDAASKESRNRQQTAMRACVNGNGAECLAKALLGLFSEV